MQIHTLRHRVNFEAACQRLFRSGSGGLFGRRPTGTLAEFYVPYYLFSVEIERDGRLERSFWAIDGRDGELGSIPVRHLPEPGQLIAIETTNSLAFKIDEAHARALLHDHLLHSYRARHGSHAARALSMTVVVPALRLHWPFWVAAIGQRPKRHLQALDAVYGQEQSSQWSDRMVGRRRIEARPPVVGPR